MDTVAVNLSRPPYFENLLYTQSEYKIQVFADMVDSQALRPPVNNAGATGRKQAMKGFSDKSRHNMIEFLAKVERVPDLFVTLTYSDDIAAGWYLNVRNDFELFRKRLEYHYPEFQAMWRLEFVPRKSGHMYGMFVPHFHLLVWLPEGTPQARIEKILEGDGQLWRNAWHNITHSEDEHHLAQYGCRVERIKSRRHAYAYCSKYLAKDNQEQIEFGRRWGRIGKFEQPIEYETELTYPEYKHFKRLLNAFIKAEAYKRHKYQKITIPFAPLPLSHFQKFYKRFVRMNVNTGSSVFGLGWLSQDKVVGLLTIIKMIRHARELAADELVSCYANRNAVKV